MVPRAKIENRSKTFIFGVYFSGCLKNRSKFLQKSLFLLHEKSIKKDRLRIDQEIFKNNFFLLFLEKIDDDQMALRFNMKHAVTYPPPATFS